MVRITSALSDSVEHVKDQICEYVCATEDLFPGTPGIALSPLRGLASDPMLVPTVRGLNVGFMLSPERGLIGSNVKSAHLPERRRGELLRPPRSVPRRLSASCRAFQR